ncbi:MAG TPA: hypothetical protein VGD17_01300 [Chitinophagaceae bacterium]
MKKLIIYSAVLFLAACADPAGKHQSHDQEAAKEHSDHADHAGQLTLNNGKKWQLDQSTRENFAQISSMLSGSAEGKDLNKLGTDLLNSTNELVSECRMKGPDHDALHIWLNDYMEDLKKLRDPAGDKNKAYTLLQEDIQTFGEYFE